MIYLVAQIALFLLAALLLGLILGWLVWGRRPGPPADFRLAEAHARIAELEAALAAERAPDGPEVERAV